MAFISSFLMLAACLSGISITWGFFLWGQACVGILSGPEIGGFVGGEERIMGRDDAKTGLVDLWVFCIFSFSFSFSFHCSVFKYTLVTNRYRPGFKYIESCPLPD